MATYAVALTACRNIRLQLCRKLFRGRYAAAVTRSLSSNSSLPSVELDGELAPTLDPVKVARRWYPWWEGSGKFESRTARNNEHFTMLLPPPNVTGSLHVGHALTVAVQDSLVRWRRLCGDDVTWIPGTDHAGIATQIMVENMLRRRGENPSKMSRRELLSHIAVWRKEHGDKILQQLRSLGASLDWSKLMFTLDPAHSTSVREAFVQLYEAGLIYRALRFVNWSCYLQTAISDIEVQEEHYEEFTEVHVPGVTRPVAVGAIYEIAYPMEGGGEVVVATTRPETIPADTAVAVHPDDGRYSHFHGKFAINPVTHKRIPLICDAQLVDMEKGTGAAKVTPCHDPRDYECGLRHNLPQEQLFDDQGYMVLASGERIHRFLARDVIIDTLHGYGFYRGMKDFPMTIHRCSRSGDIIEPMLQPQWYVDTDDMSKRAMQLAEDGELHFYPEQYGEVWRRWLGTNLNWCISRQLYWGHQIPAWRVLNDVSNSTIDKMVDGPWVVARTEQEAKEHAAKMCKCSLSEVRVEQDSDVLDTWFSSALLPLSVAGWPERVNCNYPLSVMETGSDILFFWVARMVMLCLQLHKDGKPPFSKVYLHPLVLDAQGQKMSKTKGNVIDPLHLVNGASIDTLVAGSMSEGGKKAFAKLKEQFPEGFPACGPDALRFCLASYMAQETSIHFDVNNVILARNFSAKLWNATRFALQQWPKSFQAKPISSKMSELTLPDQWIMHQLSITFRTFCNAMDNFEVGDAARAVRRFAWNKLCDVHVEMVKKILSQTNVESRRDHPSAHVLYWVLATTMQLMHPFMPHITEELWQYLPHPAGTSESIMTSCLLGKADLMSWHAPDVDLVMEVVLTVMKGIRYFQAEFGLFSSEQQSFRISFDNEDAAKNGQMYANLIQRLLNLGGLQIEHNIQPDGLVPFAISGQCTLYADLKSTDCTAQREKLTKKQAKLNIQKGRLEQAIARDQYTTRVPPEIQEQDRQRLQSLKDELTKISNCLAALPKSDE